MTTLHLTSAEIVGTSHVEIKVQHRPVLAGGSDHLHIAWIVTRVLCHAAVVITGQAAVGVALLGTGAPVATERLHVVGGLATRAERRERHQCMMYRSHFGHGGGSVLDFGCSDVLPTLQAAQVVPL